MFNIQIILHKFICFMFVPKHLEHKPIDPSFFNRFLGVNLIAECSLETFFILIEKHLFDAINLLRKFNNCSYTFAYFTKS